MKKGKKNFKVLTKKETQNVKGGSWFSSWGGWNGNGNGWGWLSNWFNNYNNNNNGGGGCPPPEPD